MPISARASPFSARSIAPATIATIGACRHGPKRWRGSGAHRASPVRSSGGATAFTSVFGSGKTTGSHTLTLAEIPSHTHTFASDQVYDGAGGTGGYQAGSGVSTGAAGGGGGHTHTLSLDLQYVDLIIATKD